MCSLINSMLCLSLTCKVPLGNKVQSITNHQFYWLRNREIILTIFPKVGNHGDLFLFSFVEVF